MKPFKYWDIEFTQQNMYIFNSNDVGAEYYLKIRSIFRKDLMSNFERENGLSKQTMESMYNLLGSGEIALNTLNKFISKAKVDDIKFYAEKFNDIKSELFKLQHYNWGGDQVNSLDKKIVSVVKSHYKYDEIISQLENQIKNNVEKYTLNSWFNNWSAILTEYLFKKEEKVFPALGRIKSVDFFIDGVPLDLKTTFFPQGYIKEKRETNELTELKKLARKYSCSFDKEESDDIIKYQIVEQIKLKENKAAIDELNALLNENIDIIDESIKNPDELIKWLYENQGEMRFGSENRLFIVLIDKNNLSDSWKLKRDFDNQQNKISAYIKAFDKNKMRKIKFVFKEKNYESLADCIFIVK